MTKRRGWFCNICGVLVASVGKNLMLAIEIEGGDEDAEMFLPDGADNNYLMYN